MKLKFLSICIITLLLASCKSNKKVVETQQKPKPVVVTQEPVLIPSVKQIEHVKKLENEGRSLNKYTLDYIRKYAPIAVREMHHYKIPASITLAQGILESGNGRSFLASKSNNHFGIKCHTGWTGQKVYHDDDEKGECFRKYYYVKTSYEDHSKFLTQRRRYAFLFNYNIRDYKSWAKGLRKAGYATDPKYPNKLIKIIETYKLYDFDKFKAKDFNYKDDMLEDYIDSQSTDKANYYVVKKGDTLYSLSKKFNTTVEHLKKINNLVNNALSIGQHLLTR